MQSAAPLVSPVATNITTLILQGATLAAVLWLFRSVQQLREDHVELRTVLVGVKGENGINGDVKALRARSHHQGDAIHTLTGKVEVVTIRLDAHDRRVGEEDRRHHAQ
jgi:hypothetical protein